MAKRPADTDLNRDNFDRDDSPEKELIVAGEGFKRASEEELAKRKIKTARRRLGDSVTTGGNEGPSIFKNFTGFGSSTASTSSKLSFDFSGNKSDANAENKRPFEATSFKLTSSEMQSSSLPLFNFGKPAGNFENVFNVSKPNGSLDANSKKDVDKDANISEERSKEGNNKAYLARLGALNVGVMQWIQKHVEKNANINLIPVFDDYKKHFEELQKTYNPKFSKTDKNERSASSELTFKNGNTVSEKQTPPSSEAVAVDKSSKSKSPEILASKTVENKSPVAAFSFGSLPPTTSVAENSKHSSMFSFGANNSTTSVNKNFSFGTSDLKDKDSCAGTGFSFASGSYSIGGPLTFGAKDTAFSFGSSAPAFNFGGSNVATTTNSEEEDAPPPPPQIVDVKEDGAFYEKKCKLFYKKDGNFIEKGVCMLFLKKAGEKSQLIVRAATNLGTVLLNIILNKSHPTQRVGKNNVIIVCVPSTPMDGSSSSGGPEPVTMLIRVKTTEDADELLAKLDENKS